MIQLVVDIEEMPNGRIGCGMSSVMSGATEAEILKKEILVGLLYDAIACAGHAMRTGESARRAIDEIYDRHPELFDG